MTFERPGTGTGMDNSIPEDWEHIPKIWERDGNEKKNIPEIRVWEGNEKIYSRNSGTGRE